MTLLLELDDDGYPAEDSVTQVAEYPIRGREDCAALLAAVREVWQYADCGYWSQDGDLFTISTAGWSGNESLIGAMQDNAIFWMLCWQSSRRGGHFELKLPGT
jgi:hypothetical protein